MPIPHRRVYMERYGGGSIVVSDYNPAWSATFEQERTILHTALGPLVLTIEHIGSTAVPGLAAKPIIDLHRSPVKRPQPRRSTIKLRRAASGAGLCLHAAVRGPVARRAFLPEGTFRAMDTPPPYFARRRSPVAGPSSVS